jgi:hypothetical protein
MRHIISNEARVAIPAASRPPPSCSGEATDPSEELLPAHSTVPDRHVSIYKPRWSRYPDFRKKSNICGPNRRLLRLIH